MYNSVAVYQDRNRMRGKIIICIEAMHMVQFIREASW